MVSNSIRSRHRQIRTNAIVDEDIKDGISASINGTPGVLLRDNASGKTLLVGGAIPEDSLLEQVRNLLANIQAGR